jgi:DNA-binding protein H-NS
MDQQTESPFIEVDNSGLQELLKQRSMIEAQIQKKKNEMRAQAIAQVRSIVRDFDLKATDIFSQRATGKTAGTAKYRDPVTGKTWTGRGKPPNWIIGKDRSQFAI